MDFENHNCGHIFGTFKANLIKPHVLVPIRLNRKLKIIFRAEPLSRCLNVFFIILQVRQGIKVVHQAKSQLCRWPFSIWSKFSQVSGPGPSWSSCYSKMFAKYKYPYGFLLSRCVSRVKDYSLLKCCSPVKFSVNFYERQLQFAHFSRDTDLFVSWRPFCILGCNGLVV